MPTLEDVFLNVAVMKKSAEHIICENRNLYEENQIFCCGICDDDLYGVLEFYHKCKDNNIKPLIGLEIIYENCFLFFYDQHSL